MKKSAVMVVAAGLLVALSGCSASVTTAATATVSKAQSDLQTALDLYGVAKGIGEVAELANPALAVPVGAAIAALDPLAASAQATLTDATVDATAIEALASQISAQANALTLAAAPVVTVVPNSSAAVGSLPPATSSP